jgi:hypothetical protein
MYEEKSHVGMFQCYFCGENVGVLLDKRLRKTLPRMVGVIDMAPCDKCKDYMKQGILFISIKNDTTADQMKGPIPNPYRTGDWAVIKEEAVKNALEGSFLDFALKNRFMFITDLGWDELGIPRTEVQ